MLPLSFLVVSLTAMSDDLVREVVIGHRATLDLIRTFSATVSFTDANDPGLAKAALYLRDNDRWCLHIGTHGQQLARIVSEPGRIRQHTQAWTDQRGRKLNPPQVAGRIWTTTEDVGKIEVWRGLSLSFETGIIRYDHLNVAIALPGADPVASRDSIDGRPMIRLSYTCLMRPDLTWRQTFWHDPSRGYLVVRRDLNVIRRDVNDAIGKSAGNSIVMTDFVSSGGIEFPTKATTTVSARGDQPATVQTTSLVDVQINRPLPSGIFDLSLPVGTRITDDVRKTEYIAGPDWKPVGPEKPWSRLAVVTPATSTDAPSRQSAATESRSWTWWLAAASGVLLTVGGLTAVVRRSVRGRLDTSA